MIDLTVTVWPTITSMEESASQIFLQLTTGAAGGIAVGMLLNEFSLSKIGDTFIGAVGGALGCLALVLSGWAGLHIISDLASSTLGGAILVLGLGTVRKAMVGARRS